jgi:hypothetical protein
MEKSLDEIKQKISQKYLGKSGIHGVGVHRKKNALRIYTDADSPPQQQEAVLQEIRKDAAPYQLITIVEEKARIS